MKPQIYPTRSNQEAADGLRALGFRANDVLIPRHGGDTWAFEVLKDRKLLNGAFCYKPSEVGKWLARLAEAIDMAAVEAVWYPNAGWRE